MKKERFGKNAHSFKHVLEKAYISAILALKQYQLPQAWLFCGNETKHTAVHRKVQHSSEDTISPLFPNFKI